MIMSFLGCNGLMRNVNICVCVCFEAWEGDIPGQAYCVWHGHDDKEIEGLPENK